MKSVFLTIAAAVLPLALLASLPPLDFENVQVILQVEDGAPYVATTKNGELKLFDPEALKSLEIGDFRYEVISDEEAFVLFQRPDRDTNTRMELVFKDRVSGEYVLVTGDKRQVGKFIVAALRDGDWSYDASTGVWIYIEDDLALS